MIRRLAGKDAEIWREIRLEALGSYPEAFGAAHEDWIDRPLTDFAAQLDRSPFFAAFDGDRALGTIGWYRGSGSKLAHRGHVVAVYVRPDARGRHVGDSLMEAVIADARGQVLQLELGVGAGNGAAYRLYRRHGFQPTGAVPRVIKTADRFVDEISMVLSLDR